MDEGTIVACIVSPYAADRAALAELLGDFGCVARTAATLDEAVDLCPRGIAAIVVDGDIPELAGGGTARTRRVLLTLAKTVVVFGGDDRCDFGVGIMRVTKPVNVAEMVKAVRATPSQHSDTSRRSVVTAVRRRPLPKVAGRARAKA